MSATSADPYVLPSAAIRQGDLIESFAVPGEDGSAMRAEAEPVVRLLQGNLTDRDRVDRECLPQLVHAAPHPRLRGGHAGAANPPGTVRVGRRRSLRRSGSANRTSPTPPRWLAGNCWTSRPAAAG